MTSRQTKWLLIIVAPLLASGFTIPVASRFLVERLGQGRFAANQFEYVNTFPTTQEQISHHRTTSLFASSTEVVVDLKNNKKVKHNPDSIESFARDVATVLKELRSDDQDPTMPKLFRRQRRLPNFASTWTLEDWERHTSRYRFVDYITSFPRSRLLIRCAPQLLAVTMWSALASWLCHLGKIKMFLPLTTLSLMSTFVAALISLRSNQGLSRLNDGRQAFGKVVLHTRDMAGLIASNIYPKDPMLALKLLRHVSLFGWLLKNFLRGEAMNGTDEDIIRAMLSPADADYVLRQRKKPVAVVTRLRQVFNHMAEEGQLNTAEELALDHMAHDLNHCITTTERIRASPIPPLYTAHTGRLLLFYLFFLPLALRGGNMLNGWATVLTTTAVAYTMLGLDEISHLLEQPFKLMPLYHLSKNSMTDVGDAIVCQPPSLEDAEQPSSEEIFERPPYW